MLQDYFLALLDWWKITIKLHAKEQKSLFKEGDVWWCSIGMNVGVEIFGKGKDFTRPIIVFKKFDARSFLGIPLTTQYKEGVWHIPLVHNGKKQYAVLSQLRMLDSRRLIDKMGSLNEGNYEKIRDCFVRLYTIKNIHPASPSSEENNAGISG
jgi:mRNA interferase MazF